LQEKPIYSEIFSLFEAHGPLMKGYAQKLTLYKDHILIHQIIQKRDAILRYDQILEIFYGKRSVLVTRTHNAFLRGLFGSMIAGETGAILGALSALPSTKEENRLFLSIAYKNNAGQDAVIFFEDTRHWKGREFVSILRRQCGLPEPEEANPKTQEPTVL